MDADEPKATLYDFAYIDRERAKSLTAQLFSGLNVSVQKNSAKTESRTTEAGVDFGVTGKHAYASLASSGDSKTYDPHDLAYLDLVNGLREGGYLKEDQPAYQVGDIVLATGQLLMVNFDAMGPVINLLTDTRKKKNTALDTALGGTPQEKAFVAGILDLTTHVLPMTIQIYLKTHDQTIWGMIDGANSREPIGTVLLKYGSSFPGIWHMLAIVDVVDDAEADISCIPELVRGLSGMSEKLRPLFGRPPGLVGVTPLLLFRKLSK